MRKIYAQRNFRETDMGLAFIETSAINYCCDNNIPPDRVRFALAERQLTPVVGMLTTIELAACHSKNIEKAQNFFIFLRKLNPEFPFLRPDLYDKELIKLIDNEPFSFIISDKNFLNSLNHTFDLFCKGDFKKADEILPSYQTELKINRGRWQPAGQDYKQFTCFSEFRVFVWKDAQIKGSKSFFWIKENLQSFGINLNDDFLLKLILSIDHYPALRASIYSKMFLEYVAEKNQRNLLGPKIDTLSDGVQIIEGAYCQVFVSNDKYLLKTQLNNLNPDAKGINIQDLV